MKSTINYLISFIFATVFGLSFINHQNVVVAQIGESNQFFEQGNREMEQQIQDIQQENQQNFEEQREQKEEELENQLEIKSPQGPKIQEVPDNSLDLDDNVPESSNTEVEVTF